MGMTNEERTAMNGLIHALVERVDEMGQGRQLMDYLGPKRTAELMDGYREHDRKIRKR